jgi:TetR/AcrR family transcriptional regulator, transcriptional repressor for nem operon
MARPRSFSSERVVEAAKHVFWERGYEGTAVEDLERKTRLNRSSLYLAFGTKQALFYRALNWYEESFIGPLLEPMERETASDADIAAFFSTLARRFRKNGPVARQGCLMINSIAELEGRDARMHEVAVAYRDRLYRAFANALAGTRPAKQDRARLDRLARFLSAATIGVWLQARVDPIDAARACDALTNIRSLAGKA